MSIEQTEKGKGKAVAKVVAEGKKMDHMVLKEKKRYVCHTESLVNAEMVNIAR